MPPPTSLPTIIHLGCPSAPALSALFHALNLDWSSVSHMVNTCFNAILSNHPTLAFFHRVQKTVFLYLCIFCCLAYRIIITIFLNSISMHQYTVLVSFFLIYFTLYSRLQFHSLIRTDSNVFFLIAE